MGRTSSGTRRRPTGGAGTPSPPWTGSPELCRTFAGQGLGEVLAARERVQRRQECRLGVDGGLGRRGEPHRVRPERLEQEAEGAEVLLQGPHFGGQVFWYDHRHGAFEGGRRGLRVLPQPLVEDPLVGAVLVEDDQAIPLLVVA